MVKKSKRQLRLSNIKKTLKEMPLYNPLEHVVAGQKFWESFDQLMKEECMKFVRK